jgi:hippurate hydrolase
MRELCSGFATAYDVEITLDNRNTFDVLINDEKLSEAYLEAAEDIVGKENISGTQEPATGSEDFADMLNVVPGAYCRIGHSGTTGLHNPSFFLDPNVLPVGASVMARIVERRLSK